MAKSPNVWGKEIIDLQLQLLGTLAVFLPENGKSPINAWSVFYEKEVKPLLNAPQVGLARYYQERSNRLMEKCNAWNQSWLEFLSVVTGPLGESLCALQRERENGDRANSFAEECKSVYQAWIRQLDPLYQNLLRSSDFVECLSNTLEALEGFVKARMEYMEDLGKAMQLPTLKDLDEAYRELYLLKKEVKAMKKGHGAKNGRREQPDESAEHRVAAARNR